MRWTHYVLLFLGLWLIASPATFGYADDVLARNNDIACGLLVIAFGIYSMTRLKIWASWTVCIIGLWLQFAPLLFWAEEPAIYLNETFCGILLIGFSILIPRLPHEAEDHGPKLPLGWSFNPSEWRHRLPIISLACFCWFLARYLASYQLGYNAHVFDPIFHDGTQLVLTSKVSHAFPVPDAGLGAMCYTLEALLGCIGGEKRWRTMPWIVLCFGILVVPVSIISIILVILQPVAVGAWCAICLLIACLMLMMALLGISEVIATLQFLRWSCKKGHPFWHTFWKGGSIPEGMVRNKPSPKGYEILPGISPNINLVLSALIGLFLMLSPSFFTMDQVLADNIHIIGAVTITFSVLSMAELLRHFRFSNTILKLADPYGAVP